MFDLDPSLCYDSLAFMPTIDVSRSRIEGAFDRWDRPDDVASAFLRRRPFEAPPGEFFLRGSRGGDPLRLACVGVWEWGRGPRLTSDGSEATWGVWPPKGPVAPH